MWPSISIFIFWIYFWNWRIQPSHSYFHSERIDPISIFIFWIYFWNTKLGYNVNFKLCKFQSSFSESTFETNQKRRWTRKIIRISIFIFWIYFWNSTRFVASSCAGITISIFIFWIYFWNYRFLSGDRPTFTVISIFIFWIYFWNLINNDHIAKMRVITFQSSFSESTFETNAVRALLI